MTNGIWQRGWRLHHHAWRMLFIACIVSSGELGFAQPKVDMTWVLRSTAFRHGERIPTQHTCQGADDSPPLAWTTPPQGTKSLALIVDDPDAPGTVWVHWVAYNLPPNLQTLPEGIPREPQLTDGTLQGLNDFGRVGYGGPCPPAGTPHHYRFTLYALDVGLTLPARATNAQLQHAMQGHLLSNTQLIGLYQR